MKELDFFREAMKLKQVRRQGWVYRGIRSPESVAEHSFGVALLAILVPLPQSIDREELVRMALVHDLGEAVIGDVVVASSIYGRKGMRDEKERDEKAAVLRLFPKEHHALQALCIEYIEKKSERARFLEELDKLEMVLQAFLYQEKGEGKDMAEFWRTARARITQKEILNYLDKLKERAQDL